MSKSLWQKCGNRFADLSKEANSLHARMVQEEDRHHAASSSRGVVMLGELSVNSNEFYSLQTNALTLLASAIDGTR